MPSRPLRLEGALLDICDRIGMPYLRLLALLLFILPAHAGIGDEADITAAPKNDGNPYTDDTAAVAEGKSLWGSAGCYSCHGGKAEGGLGPSLTDDDWVYTPTDKTLFKAISQGRPGTNMVGWSKDLSDEQIWKLIAYIRSLYEGDPDKIIW